MFLIGLAKPAQRTFRSLTEEGRPRGPTSSGQNRQPEECGDAVPKLSADPGPDFSRMLGRKLRSWRRFRGLSPTELATRAAVSIELLREAEDGLVAIESDVLTDLLAVLDVSLYELLTSPGPARRRGKAITHMRPTEDHPTSEG